MRVIAGDRKGFRLKGPAGPGTRPMADKIKGALFSMLDSLGVAPERVLDLYAGTGSIGIEALSRGASRADFVEHTRDACQIIRDNLTSTGFAGTGSVHQMPVKAFISGARTSYDFVIMDPPYADPEIIPTLDALGNAPLVQCGSIVVIGHSPRVELPDRLGRLDRFRLRCHGDSCFSLYDVTERRLADGDDGAGPLEAALGGAADETDEDAASDLSGQL